MPLAMATQGSEMTVQKINGDEDVKRFLYGLGFNEGTKVSVITVIEGNLIVKVKDARIAITRAMAQKIMVA